MFPEPNVWLSIIPARRSQNSQPIQMLEDVRDAFQALHVDRSYICTGPVDGHVRTYHLWTGELSSGLTSSAVCLSVAYMSAVVPSQDNHTYLSTMLDIHA